MVERLSLEAALVWSYAEDFTALPHYMLYSNENVSLHAVGIP